MGDPAPILDVRNEAAFAAGHAAGAGNIPLEELARRTHELPPKGSAIRLFDQDPERLEQAAAALRLRGYVVREAPLAQADLSEIGPSRARLWQPSPFLVEALDRIGSLATTGNMRGRALDVACGSGREAVYLAAQGYEVDAIDALPDALQRARDLARRHGVSVSTIQQDLRHNPALPLERYDLVTVFRFLHRTLLPAIRRSVAPGGFIVYEAFHRKDGGREGKPPGTDHTFADDELASAFEGFELLISRDGIERDGRVFSQLLARRRS